MECISISFRSAPEETRKRFAFPAGETGIKEREAFLERAGEAVLQPDGGLCGGGGKLRAAGRAAF